MRINELKVTDKCFSSNQEWNKSLPTGNGQEITLVRASTPNWKIVSRFEMPHFNTSKLEIGWLCSTDKSSQFKIIKKLELNKKKKTIP